MVLILSWSKMGLGEFVRLLLALFSWFRGLLLSEGRVGVTGGRLVPVGRLAPVDGRLIERFRFGSGSLGSRFLASESLVSGMLFLGMLFLGMLVLLALAFSLPLLLGSRSTGASFLRAPFLGTLFCAFFSRTLSRSCLKNCLEAYSFCQ